MPHIFYTNVYTYTSKCISITKVSYKHCQNADAVTVFRVVQWDQDHGYVCLYYEINLEKVFKFEANIVN